MAYEYRLALSEGGYVEFNVLPGSNFSYGVGDTIIITGRIKSSYMAIKSIELSYFNSSHAVVPRILFLVNKSISKGTLASFTISHTITDSDITSMDPTSWANDTKTFGMAIWIYNKEGGWNGSWSNYDATSPTINMSFIRRRYSPQTSLPVLSDDHASISDGKTPLEFFGNYIQGESMPHFTMNYSTDSNDIKLTTSHRLVIINTNDGNVIHDITDDAVALSSIMSFSIPPIASSGIYTYEWTVTDSAGLSASESGTFTVLAYSPPEITTFLLDRYKYIIDEGNVIADDGENLLLTFNGFVSSVIGPDDNKNAWSLDLKYNELDSETINYQNITSDIDGRDIEYNLNDEAFTTNISASSTFNFIVTLSDMLNTVRASYVVLKAGGYLNIEKTGVAVGMRSTSSALDKKFEVAEDYASHFYGGIEGVNNYSTAEVLTGGHWIDGKPLYHKVLHVTTKDTIDLSGLDFDFIRWELAYKFTFGSSAAIQWSSTYYYSSTDYAMLYVNGTNLIVRMCNNIHLIDAYIFLEYTKNTIATT